MYAAEGKREKTGTYENAPVELENASIYFGL
jgi:hypothetical protein